MRLAKLFAGPILIGGGLLHFFKPRIYEGIVPDWLPAHRELVYASGVTELLAGAGSLHPATRRPAGWLGILTMVGVFPANLHMALHPERYRQVPGGEPALWGRLPLQALFVYWIWRATLSADA